MSSALQYVTLVVQGGTPIRMADQMGAPYPTTGRGSLVFADGPVLNNPIFTGSVITFDNIVAGFAAGEVGFPSIYFTNIDSKDGFFSSGEHHVNVTINGVQVADFSSTGLTLSGAALTVGTGAETSGVYLQPEGWIQVSATDPDYCGMDFYKTSNPVDQRRWTFSPQLNGGFAIAAVTDTWANQHYWTFARDGSTTMPGDLIVGTPDAPPYAGAHTYKEGWVSIVGDTDWSGIDITNRDAPAHQRIWEMRGFVDGSYKITAWDDAFGILKQWTFARDGSTTFPGDLTVTNGIGGSAVLSGSGWVDLASVDAGWCGIGLINGTNPANQKVWNINAGGSPVGAFKLNALDDAFAIQRTWTFNRDGTTTFPDWARISGTDVGFELVNTGNNIEKQYWGFYVYDAASGPAFEGNMQLSAWGGGVGFPTLQAEWVFKRDGTLTAPGMVTLTGDGATTGSLEFYSTTGVANGRRWKIQHNTSAPYFGHSLQLFAANDAGVPFANQTFHFGSQGNIWTQGDYYSSYLTPFSGAGAFMFSTGDISSWSLSANTADISFRIYDAVANEKLWSIRPFTASGGSLTIQAISDASAVLKSWAFGRNGSLALPGQLIGAGASFSGVIEAASPPLSDDNLNVPTTEWVVDQNFVKSTNVVVSLSATAMATGSATQAFIKASTTANFGIFYGNGAPGFTAAANSLYVRRDGNSTTTRLYVNTTGASTWATVTTSA